LRFAKQDDMTTSNIPSAPDSVLHSLSRATSELDRLLSGLSAYSHADTSLRQIASQVVAAVERSPDVAMACILLNQIAGRYAVRHCVDSAILCCLIARAMGEPPSEVLTVTAAALSMNVGLMREIERFQNKQFALTREERAMVLRHPIDSAELLRCAGVSDSDWLDCVEQHHENDDGSGYPDGRQQGEIALNAKLIGMADRYCACISARNYRRSMLAPLALEKLCSDAGNDSALAAVFAAQLGPYPPGTLVRLMNGDVGVVARRAEGNVVLVHALRSADGKALSALHRTDQPGCAIDTALHEDEAHLRFSMKTVWGDSAAL
jgi:HD-GYP domain-containing protein (c-di-GMP phosphodiesterase class II)